MYKELVFMDVRLLTIAKSLALVKKLGCIYVSVILHKLSVKYTLNFPFTLPSHFQYILL